MSAQERSELPHRRGRSEYGGFRALIKAVASGRRGSRALTFHEARAGAPRCSAARSAGAAGRGQNVSAGAVLAAAAVDDGRATATLEALLASRASF